MKKFLVFLFLIIPLSSYCQLDDLLDKLLPDIPVWKPGNAITTSISDAYPIVTWLGKFDSSTAKEIKNYKNVQPGYYRDTIQSYCLHAGTYAPTSGNGYLIAPLKGTRASVIASILRKSFLNPHIRQSEIQSLIWSIEAGCKFSDFSNEFQTRMSPLLSISDLAILNLNVSTALATLPLELQELNQFYSQFRVNLISKISDYSSLENFAVKIGIPSLGPNSRIINEGSWNYMSNGFFVRTYPKGYSVTVIEIYKPHTYKINKDKSGRIFSIERNDNSKIEINYSSPNVNSITINNKSVPILKFDAVKFAKDMGNILVENNGWMIFDQTDKMSVLTKNDSNIFYPSVEDYNHRKLNRRNTDLKYLSKSLGIVEVREFTDKVKKDWQLINDFKDGLKDIIKEQSLAAANGEIFDIEEFFKDLDFYICEIYKNLKITNTFDPCDFAAVPGNTYYQRLGLSTRKYK